MDIATGGAAARGTVAPSGRLPLDARVVRTRNDILRTALDVLLDEGRDAVTYPRIAQAAGYSRATVYKHWPTRVDLLRDTFGRLGEVEHHPPTGDLRVDLTAELAVFRSSMTDQRLDRALAALADLTVSMAELVEVRNRLVADGERTVRALLATVLSGDRLEATTLMLCGAVLQSALMHGAVPTEQVVGAAVDVIVSGLDRVA